MSKWIIPSLVSVLCAVSVSAQADSNDKKFFVGAGISAGSATHELKATGIGGSAKTEVDLDSSAGNIHIGFMLSNNNRFIISLESVGFEDDTGEELEASGIRLDWQFVYTENQVKPYFGVGFGFYSSEDLADLLNDIGIANESKIKGVSFQLMGGVKITASEQVEFDVNIQSRAIGWQDVEVYSGSSKLGTFEQTTSDVTIGVGVDFKF